MDIFLFFISLSSYFLLYSMTYGERNMFVYCGACLSMVEEFGWHMAATSEKQKILTGSFRLDSKGDQDAHQVPYKRSEIQMIELTEGICSTMYDYHIYTDPDTGRKSFIRTTGRTGEKLSLKNIMISEYITKDLQFACDTLVEEYEDDLIEFFQDKEKDIEHKFCVDTAKVCTKEELGEKKMHTAQAVMDGMRDIFPGIIGGRKFKEVEKNEADDEEYCDENDEDCEEYCEEGDPDCEEYCEEGDPDCQEDCEGWQCEDWDEDDEPDEDCDMEVCEGAHCDEYELCDEDDADCELDEEIEDENQDIGKAQSQQKTN